MTSPVAKVESPCHGEEVRLDPQRRLKVRVTAPLAPTAGSAYLDASAFLLTRLGRVVDDRHFVFYGNRISPDGAVRLRGIRDGDNVLDIYLCDLAPVVDGILVTGTVYDQISGRSLSDVGHGMVRLSDDSGQELASFAVPSAVPGSPHDGSTLGAIFRRDGSWVFRRSVDAFTNGLRHKALELGVAV
jgi:tellurium resistance protein TerD